MVDKMLADFAKGQIEESKLGIRGEMYKVSLGSEVWLIKVGGHLLEQEVE